MSLTVPYLVRHFVDEASLYEATGRSIYFHDASTYANRLANFARGPKEMRELLRLIQLFAYRNGHSHDEVDTMKYICYSAWENVNGWTSLDQAEPDDSWYSILNKEPKEPTHNA